MRQCNCRLCYLALNPPKTFALYQSFGLDKIAKEDQQAKYELGLYGKEKRYCRAKK